MAFGSGPFGLRLSGRALGTHTALGTDCVSSSVLNLDSYLPFCSSGPVEVGLRGADGPSDEPDRVLFGLLLLPLSLSSFLGVQTSFCHII